VIVSDKALADLGWPQLLQHWARRCATERGASAVASHPWFETIDQATQRAKEISEARILANRDAPLSLDGIAEVRAAIERVRKSAALDAPELIAVATSAKALARIRAHLAQRADVAPLLSKRVIDMHDLGHVYHPILDGFDSDGRLVDHASDDLGPLRKTLAAIKSQLDKRMKTLLEDERYAPYLQDTFHTEREDRCVLPVRTDGKGFVKGIVHGTSQSGQTLFIEPDEIVDLNNRKKLAECDVADEERRILVRYSGWVAEEADAIEHGMAVAEVLDVIASAARLADDTVACEPVFVDAPKVALLHARHPLMLLAERRCVANDVTVAAGQTLVISGPNAGGKTVALKTVGLAALMMRVGLHVTAESGSAMGWFERLCTDIGDAQSLEHNLSTFSGHMLNLATMLQQAKPSTLALIDEIAVGTDPEQGAVLAQAYLQAMADKGVTALVTTHYERLKGLAARAHEATTFANASVGFDMATLAPTFKLHLGMPGSSGAFAVAKRMGLPVAVVENAQQLLGNNAHRIDELLANVAEQQRRLEQERAAALAELEQAESDRAALRLARERILHKYEKQTRASHSDAVSELKVARRELEHLRLQIRERTALARSAALENADQLTTDVRLLSKQIADAAQRVAQHEPIRAALPGTVATVAQLVPGTPVIVHGIGRGQSRAVVEAAPVDGKVSVRMGQLRAMVAVADVLLDSHRAARRAAEQARRDETPDKPNGLPAVVLVDGARDGRATARSVDTTLDVRGQRMDEAVAAVDRFLDEGVLGARDVLFVVHGHGTGVLRAAIRSHAATHHGVRSIRAGEASEGGDGVTVMFLKE
jgi:DNA mismatch repair protein MutS2